MAREAKSKEEIALAKLRMNIFKRMEREDDANNVWLYAQALHVLPISLDYEDYNKR